MTPSELNISLLGLDSSVLLGIYSFCSKEDILIATAVAFATDCLRFVDTCLVRLCMSTGIVDCLYRVVCLY